MEVNKKRLSEIFDVSIRTIQNWQDQGMPVARGGGKGNEVLYDSAAVIEWYSARDAAIENEKLRKEVEQLRVDSESDLVAAWGAAMSATAISATSVLTGVGVSMMLGGVVQMLTPQPSFGAGKSSSTDNTPNYAFGAPVNTVAMGHPVPLAYGLIEAGGAIVSAGNSITVTSASDTGLGNYPASKCELIIFMEKA